MSEPSQPEVQQAVPAAVHNVEPVLVSIAGPVRVQSLPSVDGACRTEVLPADGTPVLVANEDPRRKSVKLIAADQPFYVGVDRDQVISRFAAKWPVNVPFEWSSKTWLYCAAGTGSTATTLSIVEEKWTD